MMPNIIHGWQLAIALGGACLGTYFCRAIGVILSGHINQDTEFFRWLAAVTYAMVAALTIRLILLPVGMLQNVSVWMRILICIISLGVMVSRPQRRLSAALLVGTGLMVLYGATH
ncbi:AzlD domain-containing protein [Polynucleobacter paludilacus]|uniref:AzlD domain-containing protein n=1 Tax=Polynucleobacter paludilacus TaxID=1855895 RepID=UPI001BFEBC4A|nr:AzlD domain-containing protein [Polynucleobacter paludilacus]